MNSISVLNSFPVTVKMEGEEMKKRIEKIEKIESVANDCISLPLPKLTVCTAQPQPQHPEPAVRPVQLQLVPPLSEASTPLSASLSAAATPLSASLSAQLVAVAVPPFTTPLVQSLAAQLAALAPAQLPLRISLQSVAPSLVLSPEPPLAQLAAQPLPSSAEFIGKLSLQAEDCGAQPLLEQNVRPAQPQPQHQEPAVCPVQSQSAFLWPEVAIPAGHASVFTGGTEGTLQLSSSPPSAAATLRLRLHRQQSPCCHLWNSLCPSRRAASRRSSVSRGRSLSPHCSRTRSASRTVLCPHLYVVRYVCACVCSCFLWPSYRDLQEWWVWTC
ncbi:uncharacterized protein LOC112847727 [Oreochromis niloticus]|uniref:uncharacterized protein LOC112847727 n=1 Tax=Oreochromis niloticus TaxID=8128 RepID=UPI000DF31B61|nr:uncharacterized protein LOC112847727 [Oreochromis niloticus]